MSNLRDFMAILDLEDAGEGRFVGGSDAGDRGIIDGSQVLAQSLVAAAKTWPDRIIRSAHTRFVRTIAADQPLDFRVDAVHAGRQLAYADVVCHQGDRVCVRTNVLLDRDQADFVRHASSPMAPNDAESAIVRDMPMDGRELRLDGIVDENDPEEHGPPHIRAWLRYDEIPKRDDLRKALLAHFTGHLGISTSLRPHAGVGTAQSHKTISTAPLTISITFHEPVAWDGWLLYEHDSRFAGAGMSFVRGEIFTDSKLLASFSQEAMIRGLDTDELQIEESVRL